MSSSQSQPEVDGDPIPATREDEPSAALVFESHNGYGGLDFDGEPWPYGYISRDQPRTPIFELRTPLALPAAEVAAVALKMAAAPGMYEALKAARIALESWGAYVDPYFQEKWDLAGDLSAIDAALAKATGTARSPVASEDAKTGTEARSAEVLRDEQSL